MGLHGSLCMHNIEYIMQALTDIDYTYVLQLGSYIYTQMKHILQHVYKI